MKSALTSGQAEVASWIEAGENEGGRPQAMYNNNVKDFREAGPTIMTLVRQAGDVTTGGMPDHERV